MIKKALLLCVFSFILLYAQDLREQINSGVDLYEKNKFSDAEVNFRKGIEQDSTNFNARFNLADALYKQGRYEDAIKEFNKSLELTKDKAQRAQVHHIIGNSYLKNQKPKESIDSYINSLKLNPKDMDTKTNLSAALRMMQQQQQQQQQNKNQDKKDKNEEQNKDQQQQQDNKKEKNDKKNNEQKPEPKDEKISKEQAEAMLNAIKNNEQDLQKKLRQKKGVPVQKEKDW